MPRDGSGVYAQPYPSVVSGTTIESAKYNGNVTDVAQDLNTPRPIVAGGTGATTAVGAITNLNGEISNQVITNYNSDIFFPGSFYSLAGATSAPVSGHIFLGFCYGQTGGSLSIEARDMSDALSPHLKYTRTYNGTTWSAWAVDQAATFVSKGGDTMSGDLTIAKAEPRLTVNKAANGQFAGIYGSTVGAFRWFLSLGDAASETGSGNNGSDFSLLRYNDAGANLDTTFTIARSSGNARFSQTLMIGGGTSTGILYFGSTGTKSLVYDGTNYLFNSTGAGLYNYGAIWSAPSATTGTYHFGTSGTKYLTFDGANDYSLMGGNLSVGASGLYKNLSAGDITTSRAGTPTAGVVFFGNTTTKYMLYDGTNFSLVGAVLNLGPTAVPTGSPAVINVGWIGASQYGSSWRPSADNAFPSVFYNAANAQVGYINTTSTATAYATSSDVRLKEDLQSFDAGNIIDDTEVYSFRWKSTGERSYGVSAQQANEVYPQAVSHNEQEDFWGIDYSKYVPVLLQELKALRTRVAQLEGRIDAKPA
jgi:hypothetical protein